MCLLFSAFQINKYRSIVSEKRMNGYIFIGINNVIFLIIVMHVLLCIIVKLKRLKHCFVK